MADGITGKGVCILPRSFTYIRVVLIVQLFCVTGLSAEPVVYSGWSRGDDVDLGLEFDRTWLVRRSPSARSGHNEKPMSAAEPVEQYDYQIINKEQALNVDDGLEGERAESGQADMTHVARRQPIAAADVSRGDASDVVSTWEDAWWSDWQLPVFVVLFTVVSVLAVTFVVLLWLKNQMVSRKQQASPPSLGTENQWIIHEVRPPPLTQCDPQPPAMCLLNEVMTGQGQEACRKQEPIRIKAKGLLERRGSSASLTIELLPTQEQCTSTRECTSEEYLLSAGNTLSRAQLRLCLSDARALHREFWDLPLNHPERAPVPGCGPKNRYRSILPNEASRVRLTDSSHDPLAQYINANFMRGYDGADRAYVATQGPLAHTLTDFWLLVWQERISLVVMVTRLCEQGRAKCEQYLPLEQDETIAHGPVRVTLVAAVSRGGHQMRELLLQKGDESRRVLHLWYETWPDHKTPAGPRDLVQLAEEVELLRRRGMTSCVTLDQLSADDVHDQLTSDAGRLRPASQGGPVLVHCSAGIGRTGCFIAVSVGINQLIQEDNVDILGIVCQMRHDRGGMIQTAEQYEFVHRALCLFEQSLPATE